MAGWNLDAEQYPMMTAYTHPVKKAERPIIGREEYIDRIKAALLRPELCNVMLLAPPGSGKAHPNSTIIPVADERGYIQLGELAVGDFVFDECGRPAKVVKLFPQGKKRVFEVELSNGATVECNDEHLWAVRTETEAKVGAPYRILSLRNIMDEREAATASNPEAKRQAALARLSQKAAASGSGYRNGRKVYVPGIEQAVRPQGDVPALIPRAVPGNRAPVHVNIPPVVFGMLLVRGADRCGRLLQARVPDSFLEDLVECGLESVSCLGGVTAMLLPVCDDEDYEPAAVELYLKGSIEQRIDVLRGVISVAGQFRGGQFKLQFDDAAGLEATQRMAWSLGLDAQSNKRTHSLSIGGNYDILYQLCVTEYHRSTLNEYHDRNALSDHDVYVMSIRDMGRSEDMTCIMLETESHLYQVGYGHAVTHNTAVVQGTMVSDPDRMYLEVDLAKMIANLRDNNEMAANLKSLFDEVANYVKYMGKEIVLFIDEFHQVVQLSDAAVEALKPLLADSGTRRIKVIAATTFVEFRKYISPNQPLVERLQRINLPEPDEKVVVQILRGMAERYGVASQFPDDRMFHLIYEYTNRYIPANSQPRKSILIMDSMIGWYRATKRHMDEKLLADVIYESEGINVAFKVDATKIKANIDQRVLSQEFATRMIEDRLQICVAGLNNANKPMSSFLFSGSTGSGKTETCKALADILFGDARHLMVMNMTEYANPDSMERFRKELTTRIWERPYSIVLLDEIEKACAPVTRLLLSVLDEGQLSDENNRIVSFKNAYIIMTTNAGSEIYKTIGQYNVDDTGSGSKIMEYYPLIRDSISSTTGDNKFPPELLGRIDVIVPFQPLSVETMKRIVRMNLQKLNARVKAKHGVDLRETHDVIDYLVEDNMSTDSDAGGARMVMQKLESDVSVPVAAYINKHPDKKQIFAYVVGTMLRDNKQSRISQAHIEISDTYNGPTRKSSNGGNR